MYFNYQAQLVKAGFLNHHQYFPWHWVPIDFPIISQLKGTHTHTIHGTIVYLPAWMVEFYVKSVGKYTNPMDGMG